jgi:surface antigen
MNAWAPRLLLVALLAGLLPTAAAQAQVNPFRGSGSRGLSPKDNQLLFDSINRLNQAQPAEVGRAETWSDPRTHSSGTSTIIRVFRSGGMACHLVRHHIVAAGRQPGQNYRLTWCRTPNGEWKIKA